MVKMAYDFEDFWNIILTEAGIYRRIHFFPRLAVLFCWLWYPFRNVVRESMGMMKFGAFFM